MDALNNDDRAERAKVALQIYLEEWDARTGVVDLLSDLMHYCNREDVDFEGCIEMSTVHFNAEFDEENNDVN
jgi:hypothetical protein